MRSLQLKDAIETRNGSGGDLPDRVGLGGHMSKPALGLLLGGLLGLIDGLSALFYPGTAPMIVPIVIGSTIKGLVTGVAMGVLARRVRSLPVGIAGGLVLGLVLSYLAAMTPDPQGQNHYAEIMLPGAILGVIVGFATQRFGRPSLSVPESGASQ